MRNPPESVSFQVADFRKQGFLFYQGKNAVNTVCIHEYFNADRVKIHLSKTEFALIILPLK